MKRYQKVLVGIVAFIVVVVVLALWFTQGITDTANRQLAAIRAGDAATAYALTSRSFQNTTSFEEFKRFIATFPPFAENQSARFSERQVDKGTGLLRGELVARTGTRTPVEFRLVKENGEWRIEGVKFDSAAVQAQAAGAAPPGTSPTTSAQLPPPAQEPPATRLPTVPAADIGASGSDARPPAGSPMDLPVVRDRAGTIAAVLVSETADETGYVVRDRSSVDRRASKIYVTVQVADARRGAVVSATLTSLATGGSIGPSHHQVTADANVQKAFSFTNTGPEWPVGSYRVTVTLSDGSTTTRDFRVD
jgi:hypothetical protein